MQVHINIGYCKHKPNRGDKCLFCGNRPKPLAAYTYFGAPVCDVCWDEQWCKTEDGQTDPPFGEIMNEVRGVWLELPDGLEAHEVVEHINAYFEKQGEDAE